MLAHTPTLEIHQSMIIRTPTPASMSTPRLSRLSRRPLSHHLRALNQQLIKKLQNHAALEAEVARLRCLLVHIRGKIEGEIGAVPYQRPVKNIDLVSSVDQGSFLGGT